MRGRCCLRRRRLSRPPFPVSVGRVHGHGLGCGRVSEAASAPQTLAPARLRPSCGSAAHAGSEFPPVCPPRRVTAPTLLPPPDTPSANPRPRSQSPPLQPRSRPAPQTRGWGLQTDSRSWGPGAEAHRSEAAPERGQGGGLWTRSLSLLDLPRPRHPDYSVTG